MKWMVLLLLLKYTFLISAQSTDPLDSTVLNFNEYLDLVINHHPMARSAELYREKASATSRMAKGGFDPKIEGNLDRKSFDDKNYFTVLQGKLKIPTWYGIDLKVDYNRSSGDFLNNSDFLPVNGLWSAGISIPLGKGLVIDERRAALKQAEIYESLSEQERIVAYNNLLNESIMAYLDWQMNYGILATFERGIQLAIERFESTKINYIQGDKPAIDTLEAYINLQSRRNQVLEAERTLLKSRQILENYLWSERKVPLELNGNVRPQLLDNSYMNARRDSIVFIADRIPETHPEILAYGLKINELELQQNLMREDLKPDFRIQFNPLVGTSNSDLFLPYEIANYKLGLNFNYTFLQRKTRGKLDLNKVKLQETQLNIESKKQQIQNNLEFLLQNEEIYNEQLSVMESMVVDNERLLNAELKKYAIGESSIFLINTREIKFIESRLKLIEMLNKSLKNRFYLFYYSGLLTQMFV